ncbi:envelope stress response membrane protein PspC [Marinihelvus fidelis]|uniref:Envelope stress response membrane protein PspC n=1 Tax=Marinihelvus fidelis TaxID=2613842 RepID=A0A5N0TH02_9GAMM|nr:envelope stress response membrane protein PspC [Marinihelvus fidelis]KAA9132559.1 envelope stress response membrane protein PspC [Marinihelvus fidelis]
MTKYGTRPNPHRLYRDTDRGMIAGVCAGISDYLGFNLLALRLVTLVGGIVFMPVVVVGYLLLAILIKRRPPERTPMDEAHEQFWRGVSNAPGDVFSNVRHRVRELDLRLQRMEAFVTSREFTIDRELNRPSRTDHNR